MSVPLLILGLVLFIGLVVIHEWGHFIVARRNGVVAEEFGIFFPPRLFKKRIKSKKGDFIFSINLLPLGGFVKMKGESGNDMSKGSFGVASLKAKSKILAAGVVINFVTAVIILMILALIGIPKLIPNQFTIKSDTKVVKNSTLAIYVEPNSPAAHGGLKDYDEIVAIGLPGHAIKLKDASELNGLTQKYAGQKVELVYKADGKQMVEDVTLRSDQAVRGTDEGHLGVATQSYIVQRSTWSAPIVAVGLTGQMTKLTFVGLAKGVYGLGGMVFGGVTGNHAASHQGADQTRNLSGIVAIVYALKDLSFLGLGFILFLIANISLVLALLNFLPLPLVDGKLWLLYADRLLTRLPKLKLAVNSLAAVGLLILLALVIAVTVFNVQDYILK